MSKKSGARPRRRSKEEIAAAAERKQAHAALKRLDLKLIRILEARIARTAEIDKLLSDEEALKEFSQDEIRAMRDQRMTNMDLMSLHRDVQDRVGTPKRTALDELMSDPNRTPITLVQGVTWMAGGVQGALVVGAGGGGARSDSGS